MFEKKEIVHTSEEVSKVYTNRNFTLVFVKVMLETRQLLLDCRGSKQNRTDRRSKEKPNLYTSL